MDDVIGGGQIEAAAARFQADQKKVAVAVLKVVDPFFEESKRIPKEWVPSKQLADTMEQIRRRLDKIDKVKNKKLAGDDKKLTETEQERLYFIGATIQQSKAIINCIVNRC